MAFTPISKSDPVIKIDTAVKEAFIVKKPDLENPNTPEVPPNSIKIARTYIKKSIDALESSDQSKSDNIIKALGKLQGALNLLN